MSEERPWDRLLRSLNGWSAATEIAPGRIEVAPDGSSRVVEIRMTEDEWDDLWGVMWGNVEDALREVREAVLALPGHQRFLVYGLYRLEPSATPELPEDPDDTRLDELARRHPERLGRWYAAANPGPGGSLPVMATHWTVGADANDPHAQAGFWAIALGYVVEPGYDDPDGASLVDPDGAGPAIGFLRVPEGKTAKNRFHLDIRVAGEPPWDMAERERLIRVKVAELVGAGATTVREETYDGALGHVVMLDPEGNEFCVA